MPVISNWSIVQKHEDKIDGVCRIKGTVKNHRYILDGKLIVSSPIQTIEWKQGIVMTLNTAYMLSDSPSRVWALWTKKYDKETYDNLLELGFTIPKKKEKKNDS